jgi:hypothetical protein
VQASSIHLHRPHSRDCTLDTPCRSLKNTTPNGDLTRLESPQIDFLPALFVLQASDSSRLHPPGRASKHVQPQTIRARLLGCYTCSVTTPPITFAILSHGNTEVKPIFPYRSGNALRSLSGPSRRRGDTSESGLRWRPEIATR